MRRHPRLPRGKSTHYAIYTSQEVPTLLRACNRTNFSGIRFKALLVLYYRTGLRSFEATSLLPGDVDLSRGTIRVVGKGNRYRVVGFDERAGHYLAHWLQVRARAGFRNDQPLFPSRTGRPLTTSYLRKKLALVARTANILGKRIHLHGFRHTCAVDMLQQGVNILTISKQLGHSSLTTTEIYLSRLAPLDVIKSMHRRPW